MKIEAISIPRKELIKKFLDDHEGELFTVKEMRDGLGYRIETHHLQFLLGPERVIEFRGQRRFGSPSSVLKARAILDAE